ncbi:hypothetical protein DPMN_124439 [Dreissena polymorpha]|uniref:Uncharacterized protein n=1 Tax=Dreissena polymorpha TaxID=45954 RepID=A0A9D4JTU3_DREPO|nr:hypothetical protein DPMN_124439 [Dreissena polymorpha]
MTTIYVTVAGIVVPCEVTKTTTCFDVIRMFTTNSGNYDHAMFESTSEKEILLSMKSSVLKVVSSWGAEWFRKSLVIRPVDAYTCRLASMSHAQRILYRLTHGRKSSARRICTGPRREAVTEKYCALTAGKPDEVLGKQDIMNRFFHDMEFNSNRSTSQLNAEHDVMHTRHWQKCFWGGYAMRTWTGSLFRQDCSRTGCASLVWTQRKTDLAIVDPM